MDPIERLCSEVSASAMFADLEEFAKRVKLSGTAEELESFQYLQTRLDEIGFSTSLIRHDAYISLPGAARLEAGAERPACITHSFSRSTGPEGLCGKLIHVGSGTEGDFAGRDVTGQIVLVDGIASPAVSLRASVCGARGQVHVSGYEHKHEMCISPVWGSPTYEGRQFLPRTVVLTVAKADGDRLKERLARGEAEVTLHADVDTGWRKTPILVAELAPDGASPTGPFVMFSGHHDTWHYGLMDNGGANATMLEVARLLAPHRASWRRGLRICFWSGHSHGRYSGSAWYADHHWQELCRRCLVHVNIDSTGGRGNTVLCDMPSSAELRPLAREAVAQQGGQELAGLRLSRAGDQSFWGIGIPSLFMTVGEQPLEAGPNVAASIFGGATRKGAGFGWWWHTPDDTLDKIDRDLLVRDTRIYIHALWRLLTDLVVPLNYASFADELLVELSTLSQAAGKGVDVEPLVEAAGRLRRVADAMNRAVLGDLTEDRANALNAALKGASRLLVPIDYTSGDRFSQDAALSQSAFPVLQAVRKLCAAADGDEAVPFMAVAAVRARNRVAHALEEAIFLQEGCLTTLCSGNRPNQMGT
jgi:Peptidase family M28